MPVKEMTGEGVAKAEGQGFLSSPEKPLTIADVWFYGATKVKSMLGWGEAKASGSGEL
jgi:hypothetical protein